MEATEREAYAVGFGRRLRALRQERGLSQERLGQVAEIHRTAIGHLEQGRKAPSLATILRLGKALEVTTFDSLLVGLPDPPPPRPATRRLST